MTSVPSTEPCIFVEGRDDEHAILHLVMRHGLTKETLSGFPLIEPSGGKEGVLEAIEAAVSAGTDQTLGFVLDADDNLDDTWRAVASRLVKVNVQVPVKIPEEGFVDVSSRYRTRVGVWIMPDNERTGELEDFLGGSCGWREPVASSCAGVNQPREVAWCHLPRRQNGQGCAPRVACVAG